MENEYIITDEHLKILANSLVKQGEIMEEVIEKNDRIFSKKLEDEWTDEYKKMVAWMLSVVPEERSMEVLRKTKEDIENGVI